MTVKINYLEIPVKDLSATKSFFSDAFDWTYTDYGEDYASIDNAGVPAGMYTAEKTVSPDNGSILMVMYSDDLEALQLKLQGLGSKILKPIFAFPGGRRFHFADPNANEYAVWSDK